MLFGVFGMDKSVAEIYEQLDTMETASADEQIQINEKLQEIVKYYAIPNPRTDFEAYVSHFSKEFITTENLHGITNADSLVKEFKTVCSDIVKEYKAKNIGKSKQDIETFTYKFLSEHLKPNKRTIFMSMYRDFDRKRNISQLYRYSNRLEHFDRNNLADINHIINIYKNSYKQFKKFNASTIEYDLSLDQCLKSHNRIDISDAKVAYDYLIKTGKQIRALSVIYPTHPPTFDPPVKTKEEFYKVFDNYLEKLSTNFPNIDYLDFFNELAYDNGLHYKDEIKRQPNKDGITLEPSMFEELLGEDYYIKLLVRARKYFPKTKLMYNEFGHESQEKCENILKICRKIKAYEREHNVNLLDGVGVQCRITSEDQNLSSINNFIQEASGLDLEVQITEMDVIKVTKNMDGSPVLDADEKQQKAYQILFEIAKSNIDKLSGFTLGDFNDTTSFSAQLERAKMLSNDPSPTLFNADGSIKYWAKELLNTFIKETKQKDNTISNESINSL